MELVAVYLYNRIPIETNLICVRSFHNLKRHGWYTDNRTNQKFTMLNKRIEIDNKWYRAMIRFESQGLNMDGVSFFKLSLPAPFIVTQCEPVESISSARWKDNKTYHGPKLGSVTEMLRAGVPVEVIDEVFTDLKRLILYV